MSMGSNGCCLQSAQSRTGAEGVGVKTIWVLLNRTKAKLEKSPKDCDSVTVSVSVMRAVTCHTGVDMCSVTGGGMAAGDGLWALIKQAAGCWALGWWLLPVAVARAVELYGLKSSSATVASRFVAKKCHPSGTICASLHLTSRCNRF